MSFNSPPSGNVGDKEVQEFVMMEEQKAQFMMQVHRLTDTCWDKCVEKVGNKLDSRQETCISNCVERFIDTALNITNRFQQVLSQGGNLG